MNSKIEKLTNVLLALACVAVLVHLVHSYFFKESPKAGPEVIAVGETLEDFGTFIDNPSEENLIIFISESCHYCRESLPFYQKVVEKGFGSDTKIIFATGSHRDPSGVKMLLERGGIENKEVAQVDSRQWKLPYTPMILKVDKMGRVIKDWRGRLESRLEDELLGSL